MSVGEVVVEVAKYLASSGVVGVAGVLISTRLNQRHEQNSWLRSDRRDRVLLWIDFQKNTILEIQELGWRLVGKYVPQLEFGEQVDPDRLDKEYLAFGSEAAQDHNRFEVLASRIVDRELRESADRLVQLAYDVYSYTLHTALLGERDSDGESLTDRFYDEYRATFLPCTREVLQKLLLEEKADILNPVK